MSFQLRPVDLPAGSYATVPAVQVHGEVDAATATDLSDALRELASPALIVDLSHVDYLDSAGFAMIDRLLDEIQAVVVISPGSVIHPAAEIINLPFCESLTEARTAVGPALNAGSATQSVGKARSNSRPFAPCRWYGRSDWLAAATRACVTMVLCDSEVAAAADGNAPTSLVRRQLAAK